MDYRYRIISLGNSSTTSRRSKPGRTVFPSHSLGRRNLFFLSGRRFFIPYSLLDFHLVVLFLCFISFLLLPCASDTTHA